MKIQIERGEVGSWRAVTHVGREFAEVPDVMGGATPEGPWVAGHGKTPSAALASLEKEVGRLYMSVTVVGKR